MEYQALTRNHLLPLVLTSGNTVTFEAGAAALISRSDDEGDAEHRRGGATKKARLSRRPPEGLRVWRANSLSFVVTDATASTPPPFAISPRQTLGKRHRISGRQYLGVGLLALVFGACSPGQSEADSTPAARGTTAWGGDRDQQERALSVRAHRVSRRPISTYVVSNTTLEAIRDVTVISRVNAILVELMVEEGDYVREGQILARLDDREVKNELSQAEIAVQQAEVAVEQAQVRAQLSRASYERAQSLFDQGLTSREEFDQVALSNRTDSLGLDNAYRQLEGARARLEAAQIQMDYTTIRSPISGTVTDRLVDRGARLNVGETVFAIQEFPPLWARIYVPEMVLPQLRVGQQARLRVQAYPDREFTGTIKMISPTVDASTGTVKVTLEIARPENLLRPGNFGTAYIATATRPDAVAIPKKAVVRERDLNYAFVVNDDGTVSRRQITSGFEEENFIEVLAGVEAGEVVVTVGAETLSDGYPVTIQAWTDGTGGVQQVEPGESPVSQPKSQVSAGAAESPAAGSPPEPARGLRPPEGGPGDAPGQMFERMMQNPEIKKRWEARLKEDPSLATDQEKRRAFFREVMSEFGRPPAQQ
jgi:membrane fusion protein, multidrug efflux system